MWKWGWWGWLVDYDDADDADDADDRHNLWLEVSAKEEKGVSAKQSLQISRNLQKGITLLLVQTCFCGEVELYIFTPPM